MYLAERIDDDFQFLDDIAVDDCLDSSTGSCSIAYEWCPDMLSTDVLLTCKEQMAVLFGEDSEDESMEDEDETSGNLVE
jgi:hypothetical protein